MRTDSADVRPNARLISIKCRIRAVSARVARGERSRARRGARNLWKFCKWPIRRTKRWRSLGGAVQHSAGPPLPLSPIDGAEKFLRKKRPPAKNLGVKFFRQPGAHHPCRPSAPRLRRHDITPRSAPIAVLSWPVSRPLWPRCAVANILGRALALRPEPRARLLLSL
jgi:hypothetical protein